MSRESRIRRGCLWALGAGTLLFVLVPWQGIIWDGGFPNVECRLKFVDGAGKPVHGVKLTVLTKAGGVCHFYPVDEFVPDQPLISDANGQMVFHHSANTLEFAGHEYSNLLGMRFGDTSAPRYDCIFSHNGREVFRTPFNFHRREWDEFQQPAVTGPWVSPWDKAKNVSPTAEEYEGLRRQQFGGKVGEFDREERTAAGNFRERFFREPPGRDPTFLVVERTIVIPTP